MDVKITSHAPGYISYVTYVSLADEELVKGCILNYDLLAGLGHVLWSSLRVSCPTKPRHMSH
ncbi:hypothetical protein SBA2_450084 [Acidobacteriia bacterium SbA2]|nr:hypothetical protein SBA2_450084 [Acidobacteriia bacterium SbA2]